MYEVLSVVIDYGFREMAVSRIEGTVDPDNVRSRKLMERLGCQREEKLRDNLMCYYLLREHWTGLDRIHPAP